MKLLDSFKGYNYSLKGFGTDLVAALTVSVVLIPQGLAYGILAGLPAEYGLYAAIIPVLVYAIFGSSSELNVGPVAIMSIMVYSIVSVYAEVGSPLFLDLILTLSLLAGIVQLSFSLLKLGALSNFISRPVLDGFISAAALIILVSQLKSLTGMHFESSNSIFITFGRLIKNWHAVHFLSLGIGLSCIIIILALQKINKFIPAAMVATLASILLTYYLSLYTKGVEVIGNVPKGLPSFYGGFIRLDYIFRLIPSAFLISIICFVGSFAISKTMGPRSQRIDGNRELMALGLSKIIGSFFLAMPSTGSFSRSAINKRANVFSRFSNVIGVVILLAVLLFFGKYFYYLPQSALAAIVITSILGLFNFKQLNHLYKIDKNDFWIFLATFCITAAVGISNGIFIGIALSLVSIVVKASKPNYEILGQLPGKEEFRSIERFPDAVTIPNTLIIRYDERLFFANADHFYKSMEEEIINHPGIQKLIIKAAAIHDLDSTSINVLFEFINYCKEREIRLLITDLPGPARDTFYKVGLFDAIGKENFHINISHAVADLHHPEIETESERLSTKYAAQSNIKK